MTVSWGLRAGSNNEKGAQPKEKKEYLSELGIVNIPLRLTELYSSAAVLSRFAGFPPTQAMATGTAAFIFILSY